MSVPPRKAVAFLTLLPVFEDELAGHGVSYCATCDGALYKGRTVVIVGGGNSAAEDILHLSRMCKRVISVHRREEFRAAEIYREQLKKAENVELRMNSTVCGLLGSEQLSGVKIRHNVTGLEEAVECDGVFIAIGRKPETSVFEGQIELDAEGFIVADETTRTSVDGVYAAGDVRTKAVRQIVTATADGAVAAAALICPPNHII